MKFMSVEMPNIIGDTTIETTAWVELDIDTLSKSDALKLMELLSSRQVVVACGNGAPCFATASQVIFRLLRVR